MICTVRDKAAFFENGQTVASDLKIYLEGFQGLGNNVRVFQDFFDQIKIGDTVKVVRANDQLVLAGLEKSLV